MTFKKAIGKLHLWLGLTSGLVVFIVALTGCIYVFQKEISEALYHDVLFVKQQHARTQPLSSLIAKAQEAMGKGKPLNFLTAYKDPTRAWEFSAYKAGDGNAISYFGALDYYDAVLIDPYTGKVTGVIHYKYEFFNIVKYIHWSLLLNTKYGQPIVGISTMIFVIMLITGVILWWPKNLKKANFNKSFKIKWNAKSKRLNYDLHNVPGFYTLPFALIVALTGMVFAFDWFKTTVYIAASMSTIPPHEKTANSDTTVKTPVLITPMDIAFTDAQKNMPFAKRIGISIPSAKTAAISISGYRGKETYYNYDEMRYDQYSGKLLDRRNYSEKNRGEKLITMNYDIHVGAALGLPGKIIAFLASLVAASLPLTGFMIWIGRKNKKPIRSANVTI